MLPCPPLLRTPADLRGGPVRHTTQTINHLLCQTLHRTPLKLSCQGCTPGFDASPFALSRSFLERVGPELSAGLFSTLPCDLDASDLEVLLFISPPETTTTLIVRYSTEHLPGHLVMHLIIKDKSRFLPVTFSVWCSLTAGNRGLHDTGDLLAVAVAYATRFPRVVCVDLVVVVHVRVFCNLCVAAGGR